MTAYPGEGEMSGTAGLEFSSSLSIVKALGYQLGDWSATGALSAELVVDPLDTSFESLVLTASAVPDERGESQETRLIVDGSVVGAAGEAVLEELRPLAPGGVWRPDQRLVITRNAYGEILQSVVREVAAAPILYERVVAKDKNPTVLEVGLGVTVAGTGFDLAVKPAWGRYQSFPLERGLFVVVDHQLKLGRMVMLEEYPASLFSSQVDTLPSVIGELLAVVGEVLAEAWDIVTATLSAAGDTMLSVGGGVGGALGGGASVLFQEGTSIVTGALGAAPGAQLAFAPLPTVSDVGPALFAATSTKKVTLIGTPAVGDGFAVGGIYILEPENGMLSKPATLTLRYTDESAAGRDVDAFSVYHYDPDARLWTPVSSSHDRAARTLSTEIVQTGGYCIGSDGNAPEFELVLPSGTPAVVTTSVPQLTVGCMEVGSGLEPETFAATLDGALLEGEWSPEAGRAVLTVEDPLVAGTHTLSVQGSDGAGNQGSTTFEIEVTLPPGQAVLRLAGATTDRVDLEATLPPDLALCGDCAAEIEDPKARRFRYPFTNCTRCGPRFSIVEALPYDRARTSMKQFELCADCALEYGSVDDRRFHAEPIACPACGPSLALLDPSGRRLATREDALQGAAALLRQGGILALRAVGGFQLLTDATDQHAVRRLRERKHREEKPLAVLFESPAQARSHVLLSEAEERALSGPEAPILLVRQRPESNIAPAVAPRNPRIGALLPYSPLHLVLSKAVGRPLVCTSGNRSEEPMCTGVTEALSALGEVADELLVHNREIVRPIDDSVARLGPTGLCVLRRARGFLSPTRGQPRLEPDRTGRRRTDEEHRHPAPPRAADSEPSPRRSRDRRGHRRAGARRRRSVSLLRRVPGPRGLRSASRLRIDPARGTHRRTPWGPADASPTPSRARRCGAGGARGSAVGARTRLGRHRAGTRTARSGAARR